MKRIAFTLALIGGLGAAAVIGVHARERGPEGMGRGPGKMMDRMMTMSTEDREALLDARLAATRTGLKLTPDQEKLWPAIETAVRDNMKTMSDMMEKARADGRPKDMMDGLNRMTDMTVARADGLRKLRDAAQPLYATLDDGQKRRLPVLMRGMRGDGEGGHRWMK